MIGLQHVLYLMGALFAAYALLSLGDPSNKKRFANAAFWGLVALSLLAGDRLGDAANGWLVIGLAVLGGFNLLGRGAETSGEAEREAFGQRYGNRLFLPILIVLATAVAGTLVYLYVPAVHATGWLEVNRETFVLLCLGVLLAILFVFLWLRPEPLAPLQEGRRLMDAVGWAAILPMMLAALGLVLRDTGVGTTIGGLILAVIPEGNVLAACFAFGIGMALFTILTGNAFAAFPVMATAIGVPVLIQSYGGDAAVVGAIGMLAGFCGTLMTPMAANFNIVPVRLLELDDQNAVVKVQIPTALPLLLVNILLIYFLAFR
jgi:uncharacterized membrane protein